MRWIFSFILIVIIIIHYYSGYFCLSSLPLFSCAKSANTLFFYFLLLYVYRNATPPGSAVLVDEDLPKVKPLLWVPPDHISFFFPLFSLGKVLKKEEEGCERVRFFYSFSLLYSGRPIIGDNEPAQIGKEEPCCSCCVSGRGWSMVEQTSLEVKWTPSRVYTIHPGKKNEKKRKRRRKKGNPCQTCGVQKM